jgi:pimeloyl-ACP methyl ester carboxylesterase
MWLRGCKAAKEIDVSALKRNNVSGDGRRTLMFAHGFGCDQNMWRFEQTPRYPPQENAHTYPADRLL